MSIQVHVYYSMVKLRYLLVEVQKNCQKEEVNITVQIKKAQMSS